MNNMHEQERPTDKGPLKIDPGAWYTPPQLSRLIPWSEPTLAVWRCQGAGPRYSKIGRRVLYLGSDVIAFIADRTQTSTAENDPPKPVGPFVKPVITKGAAR